MLVLNKKTGKLISEDEFNSLCFLIRLLYRFEIIDDNSLYEIVRSYVKLPYV